jgi:PTH1 family peptidyl-tRNA hydrolase
LPGIRLVVGLGNPGKEYERTRHNAGFWLVERFAAQGGFALRKDGKFQALIGRQGTGGESAGAWFVLPQSFMNASGRPVQMIAGFFKIPAAEILVVHDEVDFPPGTARLKQGGGIAGHNGLKDISQRLATHDYWRLRIGVGHPGDRNAVPDYVLGKPSAEDRAAIDEAIAKSIEVLPLCLSGDLQGAMQKLHTVGKEKAEEKPKPAAVDKPARKDKPVEKKAEEKNTEEKKPEPVPEKKGFFGSLFGKK